MIRYPGERAAFAELLSIVRDEVRFEDRWAIVDWIRREMHAASPEEITDLLDRAGTDIAAGVPEHERRVVLSRLDSLRERAEEIVWEQASVRGTTPEDLVDAMHEMVRVVDPTLLTHLTGVGALAGRIAKDLGLETDDVHNVTLAGRLLDIGKIALPQAALHTREPLDAASMALVEGHSALGEQMVGAISGLQSYAGWIRAHHERLDGSGYPDALRDTDIPYEVRILSVADVFDAMVCARSYRAAHSMRDAMDHLSSKAGTLYDSNVVASLEHILVAKRRRSGTSTAA
ncbi:MAG TPA: HD domain-containing phosphohydrolase [Candidatus Tumulicola sp.]